MRSELTIVVKKHGKIIKGILASQGSIVEKTVALRTFARKIAAGYKDLMHYSDISDFYKDYAAGNCPISKLEGEGVVQDELLFLRSCPMAPLFSDYKVDGDFPEYWKSMPREFMGTMKNEAVLHPLCIVHQSFRDELAKKIPKGASFVHSIAVACRSGSSGQVVFNDFGLRIANRSREQIAQEIDGLACAFYVR